MARWSLRGTVLGLEVVLADGRSARVSANRKRSTSAQDVHLQRFVPFVRIAHDEDACEGLLLADFGVLGGCSSRLVGPRRRGRLVGHCGMGGTGLAGDAEWVEGGMRPRVVGVMLTCFSP